jgi:hypothetical protein
MADGDPELEVVAALGWTEEPVRRSAARTPTGSATLKVIKCDLALAYSFLHGNGIFRAAFYAIIK